MKNLSLTFAFDSNAIRVVGSTENPQFVAIDVAKAMDYRDAYNATIILDDDEKGTAKVSTPGGEQEVTTITESGLYRLIMRSNKPETRTFQRWVTHEVLPSIRKTGAYEMERVKEANKIRYELMKEEIEHKTELLIDLYRNKIFGSIEEFREAQWVWRVCLMKNTYSATAKEIGWSASKVASRVKKYNHYKDVMYAYVSTLPTNWQDVMHPYGLWESVSEYVPDYFRDFVPLVIKNDPRLWNMSPHTDTKPQRLDWQLFMTQNDIEVLS